MSTQQVVHISLSIPLYHLIRAFQFVNTCEPQNILQQLSPNFTKIHCNSLVNKYINRHEMLNDFCLTTFLVNYDKKN
jgi:hypothetical protein